MADAFLISLSAANTLHQDLVSIGGETTRRPDQIDPFWLLFADAAGRFADACEKLDHLEDSFALVRNANIDILHWLLTTAEELQFDIVDALCKRRIELAARQFYVTD